MSRKAKASILDLLSLLYLSCVSYLMRDGLVIKTTNSRPIYFSQSDVKKIIIEVSIPDHNPVNNP
jgi:hypothetical protein